MRKFEIRQLCADDIFPVCQILTDIGIDKIGEYLPQDAIMKAMQQEDTTAAGMAIVLPLTSMVIGNVGKCKQTLYAFLGSVVGMQVEEVAKLPMGDFANLVFAVFKNEAFRDFFTAVQQQFGQTTSAQSMQSSGVMETQNML